MVDWTASMSGPEGCSRLLKLPPSNTLLNADVGSSVGLEIDEFDRRNLLGLLKVSTKNVFSAEERLATNLEILEKEEN